MVGTPPPQRSDVPRPAADDREAFAARAIVTLDGNNGDGASHRNDVGFNRMDTARGREIAKAVALGGGGLLTDAEWAWCVTKANFYRRQVGPLPAAGTSPAAGADESGASPPTMARK